MTSDRIPLKGETIFGKDFCMIPGGKGANQAVAIARFGGTVKMLGCVGSDSYGSIVEENLEKKNVDISDIKSVPGTTGTAVINVAEGDNRIIVVPGANQKVDIAYIESVKTSILGAKLVLLQNEIPQETTEYVIHLCYMNSIPVMLNPAPAVPLSREILDQVSYLTPNEHEAGIVLQEENTESLLRKYPNKLIITRGAKGTLFCDGEDLVTVPSIKADVIDTTGAGDTFCGVLAQELVEGKDIFDAVQMAQLASGLSVQKFGAQAGMPTREDVLNRFCDGGDYNI